MSFKLVDNKGSSDVRQHNRKRADELILDLIPSTEYIVNRSGKFCCKVCPKWPVFDTPVMLKRHREGEKHGRNSEEWERAHLRQVLPDPLDECGGDRTLELNSKVLLDSLKAIKESNELPHEERLRNPCNKMVSTLNASSTDKVEHKSAKRKQWTPFFQTRHEAACTMKIVESSHLNIGGSKRHNEQAVKEEKSDKIIPAKRKKQKSGKAPAKETVLYPSTEQSSFASETLDMKMQYYAKMKQSGWVLDSEGKWTKNEECEFDSDEEPPKFVEIEKWNR